MWKVVVKLDGWLSMTGMCIFHSLDMARDWAIGEVERLESCLLYTSPSPRDKRQSRMPSSA